MILDISNILNEKRIIEKAKKILLAESSVTYEEQDQTLLFTFDTQKTIRILTEEHPFRAWYNENYYNVNKRHISNLSGEDLEEDLFNLERELIFRDYIVLGENVKKPQTKLLETEKFVLDNLRYKNDGFVIENEDLRFRFKDNLRQLKVLTDDVHRFNKWVEFIKLAEKDKSALFYNPFRSREEHEEYQLLVVDEDKFHIVPYMVKSHKVIVISPQENTIHVYLDTRKNQNLSIDGILDKYDIPPPDSRFIVKGTEFNYLGNGKELRGNNLVELDKLEGIMRKRVDLDYGFAPLVRLLKTYFDEQGID